MGLVSDAEAILVAGRLPSDSAQTVTRPVAFAHRAGCGAVMFIQTQSSGAWMSLLMLMEDTGSAWSEITTVHKPWWDPQDEATAVDLERELVLTAGQSRFATSDAREAVLVAGQAGAAVTLDHVDPGGDAERVQTHAPWGMFVCLVVNERDAAAVVLAARGLRGARTLTFGSDHVA